MRNEDLSQSTDLLIGGLPRARPRQNLAERVAIILKRYIIAERLEPGHRLPAERRLADWLNVSRTVLREALGALMDEGILFRPSPYVLAVADFDRAALIRELSLIADDETEAQELIELRVILELGAIDLIVERMTNDHLREIERWVLEGERKLARGEPTYRADARFHGALLRTIGNVAIESFLPLIEENFRYDLLLNTHQLTGTSTAADQRAIEQHRFIYEALRERDLAETQYWMLEHLSPYLQRTIAERDKSNPDGA
jgi:GntR family transcriptional regulator, transcriptional repressor for pyruvate dehydrogenase complex